MNVECQENFVERLCCICLHELKNAIELTPCNHSFCKRCLSDYIEACDSLISVQCPFSDCHNEMDDAHIQRVLSDDAHAWAKYRRRRGAHIELLVTNRVHCQTPDCSCYWPKTIVGDDKQANLVVKCAMCTREMCLKCLASWLDSSPQGNDNRNIRTCLCYERSAAHKSDTSTIVSPGDGLEELIAAGVIMRCPKCNILLEKRDSGCQFIRCFYCKMDICYLTKQPRWGPNGKGDTSAGCRCGVNGVKCHPDCVNCH